MDEAKKIALRVSLDHSLKLEFHGSRVAIDAGLRAYREPDDARRLTAMTDDISDEWRIGDNAHHTLTASLRRSAFSRRAGYKNAGDVERLCVDPTMRQAFGRRAKRRNADSRNHMGRFSTEVLTEPHHVDSMLDLSGRWVDRVRDRKPVRELILDLDSSVSETYGAQEGTAYNLGNFLRRLALPHGVKHWSLTRFREKLVKIRAKVVTHARCVTLRMVEVATPRPLFKTILRRISRLGPLAPALKSRTCP